jgi:hypothetical protein
VPERTGLLQVTGRLDGVVLILDLGADPLAALLPPGLELLPQGVVAAGRHPLVLLFGQQSQVGPGLLPFGLNYLEFVLALPFVRPRDGPQGPFCHLPVLLLDRRLPTVLGRWLYGFAKRRAACRRSEDSFVIARLEDGAALLSARFAATGAMGRARELEDVQNLRCLFEQPLISQGRDGRWRYARFDFALARAALQPVAAEVVFHRAIVPGLPLGPDPIRAPGPGASTAFRVATSWTLTHAGPDDARGQP